MTNLQDLLVQWTIAMVLMEPPVYLMNILTVVKLFLSHKLGFHPLRIQVLNFEDRY